MSTAAVTERSVARWGASIIVLLLAVLVVAWWVLGDGRDHGTAASNDDALVLAQTDDDETDEAEQLSAAAIEVTYDVFLARDPFESIRPPEPVAADPDDPNATDPTTNDTTSNGTTDPDPSTPDTKDPAAADGACVTGTEAVCDGIVLVLQDVGATSVTVEVNGVSYAVALGDSFAQNFQLLSIEGECVNVLYLNGDEAEVFRLCDGDVVAK